MKLVSVRPSDKADKKYAATFEKDGRTKTTHFGQKGAEDYLQTKDKEQRKRYRERHAADLKTDDPTRAGYLSYYLLWGESTSLRQNLQAYRTRFRL